MIEEKDRVHETLERLWKIVQITAVLVGGFWTYAKFIHTEAPLFERNVTINRWLSPALQNSGSCGRSFTIELTNTGKSVLTVYKVVTRGWKFNFQKNADAFAELLDIDKIKAQGAEVLRKDFPDPKFPKATWFPFLGRYRPGEKYTHEFQLLLNKEIGAWIYLETEISIEGEARPKVGGVWDPVCG